MLVTSYLHGWSLFLDGFQTGTMADFRLRLTNMDSNASVACSSTCLGSGYSDGGCIESHHCTQSKGFGMREG